MAENKINVTVSANTRKNISVTGSQVSTEISASADTGRFWAQTAKNWAVSDVIVDNTDYSSKHYANNAKESANSAQGFANSTRQTYNAFLDSSVNANNELIATRDEALTAINDRFEEGIGDGINQITVLVDNSIAEYTEISNQIKQDNSEASKLAKDWATSEVIVDNTDYSAKYYAKKAKDNSGIFYDEISDEDIDVEIISGGYVTKADLELGLDTKQDKGDYLTQETDPVYQADKPNIALKSEIPDVSNLATKEEIPSLDGYVKDTDYATADKGGVVKISSAYGTAMGSTSRLFCNVSTPNQYTGLSNNAFVSKGTLENIKDDYVKRALTQNTMELTEEDKASTKQLLGYATPTDIMQAIASIPQFKMSIVEELPLAGEKMTLYLVPKEGTNNDVYDEYIWIEQTESFEHLGTTAVDLTDYVKNTDYATKDKGGVVKVGNGSNGLGISSTGLLTIYKAGNSQIILKNSNEAPIVTSQIDLVVKTGITTNTLELTEDEKTSARTWLGAVGSTEYASGSKGGVIRVDNGNYGTAITSGYLTSPAKTLEQYGNARVDALIGKGTLENVLTQYSKTVLTTEADYEALETKDANTLYLIEE